MAKTFDGDPIRPGDRLWKVGFGPATVIEIRHDTVLVQLQGRTKKFNLKSGIQSGETHKTYFWFDPIVAIPRKEASVWNQQKGALLAYVNSVGQATQTMEPSEDPADLPHLSVDDLNQRGLITEEMKREANEMAMKQLIAKAKQNTNVTAIQDAKNA